MPGWRCHLRCHLHVCGQYRLLPGSDVTLVVCCFRQRIVCVSRNFAEAKRLVQPDSRNHLADSIQTHHAITRLSGEFERLTDQRSRAAASSEIGSHPESLQLADSGLAKRLDRDTAGWPLFVVRQQNHALWRSVRMRQRVQFCFEVLKAQLKTERLRVLKAQHSKRPDLLTGLRSDNSKTAHFMTPSCTDIATTRTVLNKSLAPPARLGNGGATGLSRRPESATLRATGAGTDSFGLQPVPTAAHGRSVCHSSRSSELHRQTIVLRRTPQTADPASDFVDMSRGMSPLIGTLRLISDPPRCRYGGEELEKGTGVLPSNRGTHPVTWHSARDCSHRIPIRTLRNHRRQPVTQPLRCTAE
jgi:hypothetical protein